jgi:(4S)-4-hydroxy-5-phosphonooxypentane-2,3-dione isomerase
MLIYHVHVHVKPESVEAFKQAILENARASIQEPGVLRFDVVQQAGDPARFLLVEIYRDAEAQAQHRATGHYQVWRNAVADMMETPRVGVQYISIFPGDEGR